MSKFEKRKRIEERLNDKQAIRRGEFRAVGDFAVVWIDVVQITEEFRDDQWQPVIENGKPVEKRMSCRRVNVAVGDSIMGIPVTQIDPEWIEQEKQILKGWR